MWSWGLPQQRSLEAGKQTVTSLPTLAYYHSDHETVVSADESSFGLGGCLLQHVKNQPVQVAYCSHTLSESECCCTQIEKECQGSVWACEKFAKYLIGLLQF